MPIVDLSKLRLGLLMNKNKGVNQSLIGIDLGTSFFGLAEASQNLLSSKLKNVENSKIGFLESEIIKIRKEVDFMAVIAGIPPRHSKMRDIFIERMEEADEYLKM